MRNKLRYLSKAIAEDEKRLVVSRKDFSGGSNTRQHASQIPENNVEQMENFDISVVGETRKIDGITVVEDLGNDFGTGAFGFEPRGGTNELLVTEDVNISGYTGSGTFTAHDSGMTADLQTTILKASCSGANGDVAIISNGTDNVQMMLQDHTVTDCGNDNTSPPKTKVYLFYRNRLWALSANLLYWSDALPSSYDGTGASGAFDRSTDNYNMTVGEERALIGLRELGIIALGQDAVYGINPTTSPAATDKPEKIIDIGCVANKSAVQVGDDVLFMASDGVRGVFRTQLDKLQLGQSFPLSFRLKDEYDTINWAYISKACAVYFDNKYLLALPTNSATYNNSVWVYYPATQAWTVIDGWNVGAWAKVKFSGEERLYYIDSNDSSVYRAFYGTDNNGTAITATFISREEDMGYPMNYKSGGEVEVVAEIAGSNNEFTVSVSIDGGYFQSLGTVDLTSTTAPVLPINLPFTLADSYVVREKFHLDSFGKWKTIQIKIENNDDNTDPIILYGYNIVTFAEEYANE